MLEEVIADALPRTCEAILALNAIEAEGLYREAGFRSFTAYKQGLAERLNVGKRRVQQLLAHSKITGILAIRINGPGEVANRGSFAAINERQTRELAPLDEDDAVDVWQELTRDQHEPTAEEVRSAVATRLHLNVTQGVDDLESQDKADLLTEESEHHNTTRFSREKRNGRRRLVEQIERLCGRSRKKHHALADTSDLVTEEADEELAHYLSVVGECCRAADEALDRYLLVVRRAGKRQRAA